MSLSEKQQEFMYAVSAFLQTVYSEKQLVDVEFTAGDFWAREGHMENSVHYDRLAIDLNLFYKGKYVRTYEEAPTVWERLGTIWKQTHELARWGGDFTSKDLNHFSFEHEGRR